MHLHVPASLAKRGWMIGFAAMATALVLGYREYVKWSVHRSHLLTMSELPFHKVGTGNVRATLTSTGKTDSALKTKIECELERIAFVSEGRSISGSGAATLLTVIPDGSWVKKGDVLATFDSSEYEEFLRLQQIRMKRAQSDLIQAKLNLETAQMALAEFRDGYLKQTVEECDGQIALVRTDLVRSKDRLAWCERMLTKGYVPMDQVSNARLAVKRAEVNLVRSEWDKKLFVEFRAPQQLKLLQAKIESARFALISEEQRYERFEERLEYFQRMVANCTVRAPQDGMIIYATEAWRETKIEPGMQIRQGQDLFYLPDLTKMQVLAQLHESIAPRVKPGMEVEVKLEALENRTIRGKVKHVDQLPFVPNSITENKFFLATISLDDVPREIRPEMTAEVQIEVAEHDNVVTIPSEAVRMEGDRAFCYVMGEDELELRELKLGVGNAEVIEVVEGIKPGEAVLARTSLAEPLGDLIHVGPTVEPNKGTEAIAVRPESGQAVAEASSTVNNGITEGTGL